MQYSVQPRDRIFAKGYGFLSFAKNVGKNIGKNISKNVDGKYGSKHLDHAKQSAADAIKTFSKRVIQKTPEGIVDLIGNEIANRITNVSKNLQQINSEIVTNKNYKEILKLKLK